MTSERVSPSKGEIKRVENGRVVFCPVGTNYEHHLDVAEPWAGPVGRVVAGSCRAVARKVLTVPAGGNFVAPILGTPRTIQGRVVWLSEREIVVQAGALWHIRLPVDSSAIDLGNGPIEEGSLVNVIVMPGASFEPVK